MKTGEKKNISRRHFLKGMAAGAAGTATLGVLGACTSASEENTAVTEAATQAATEAVIATNAPITTEATAEPVISGPKYEVINTDILILGGGNLGVHVARSAIAEGRNVAIIDKAPFRHNGVSGYSWDYFAAKNYINVMAATGKAGVDNGKAYSNALKYMQEHNRFVAQVNLGQTLPDRDEAGHYIPFLTDDRTQGQFARRHMDNLLASPSVNVFDRTMITDLLISNGRCYGAMGIYLPTGDFRVFRANATILATGGCTQIYGWLSVNAITNATPDNSADPEMAAFRHGAGIVNSEFSNYDCMSIYPKGLGCGFGTSICGDAQEPQTIFDKDGNTLFDLNDERVWTDRSFFCRYLGEAIANGRGTETGGVYLDIGDINIRYGNERNIAVFEKFGVFPRKEKVEAAPEMFEHGGKPQVDENMMTEFPGLFCARNMSSGTSVGVNYYFGRFVGHTAADYAKNADAAEEIDWSVVNAEYERVHNIRTHKVENSLRPHEIRLAIQAAGYKGMGVYRTTKAMEESLAELVQIRKELLPRMAPADDSIAFNIEWRDAIENYNLLDLTEMSVRASLLREESRGPYLRAEFPKADDENWKCVLSCHKKDDEMVFDKVTFDAFDESVLG